jgi:FolB domain-containing protein
MSDKIILNNLRLACKVGATSQERKNPQGVIANIELGLDLSKAGEKDKISYTINYQKVIESISSYVTNEEFKLVEALAQHIANKLLIDYPDLQKVLVRLMKAKYSAEPSISVEIERRVQDGGSVSR